MAGEKRGQDHEESLRKENYILVDIEGTTTSISFVKDTLFPYVRENLKTHVETKWDNEEFKLDLQKLKEQAKQDEENKVEGFIPIVDSNSEAEKESVVKNVLWQMDCDRKSAALKQLQGHMWREAYNSGTVKGHVYDDVPKAFESWINEGRKIYVYSSGSVEAQKLLFEHSVHGNMLKYFSDYFDTEVGPKQEPNSYKNIITKINTEASNILFLTDVVKEAEAAKQAGLSTTVVIREGNVTLTDEEKTEFNTVTSFLDLSFHSSSKRQKIDPSQDEKKNEKTESVGTVEDVEMSDISEKKPDVTSDAKDDQSEKEETKVETATENSQITPASAKVENDKTEGKPGSEFDTVNSGDGNALCNLKSKANENDKTQSECVMKNVLGSKSEIEKIVENSTLLENNTLIAESMDATSDGDSKATKPVIITKENDEKSETDEKSVKNEDEKNETDQTKTNKEVAESKNSVESTEDSVKNSDKKESEKNGEVSSKTAENTSAINTDVKDNKSDVKSSLADLASTPDETAENKENEKCNDTSTKTENDKESSSTEKQEFETDSLRKEDKDSEKTETKDSKEGNSEQPESKKLNGTTQNGNTEISESDEKVTKNGLNETPSEEKVNSSVDGDTSVQNGDSASSSESVKVKKVVDSVADGAGEPVPAVVVAATS